MPSGKKKCRSGLWYKAALPPASFCYILMLLFLTVPVGSVVSAVPVILPGLPTRGKVAGQIHSVTPRKICPATARPPDLARSRGSGYLESQRNTTGTVRHFSTGLLPSVAFRRSINRSMSSEILSSVTLA